MANPRRKKSSMVGMFIEMAVIVGAVVLLSTLLWKQVKSPDRTQNGPTQGQSQQTPPATTEATVPEPTLSMSMGEIEITAYAEKVGLTLEDYEMGFDDYPERLFIAYENSPEARDFILNAPFEYEKTHEKDMTEFEDVEGVPLFLQWDKRWGYTKYSNGLGGLTGCGPTCLAMVDYYYTKNPEHSPDFMMNFAEQNGYIGTERDEDGNLIGGTEWTLFSKGAVKLGYTVKEVPLHKDTLLNYLKANRPVICHVRKCIFTSSGHYIVLVGYDEENDRLLVNDPNSVSLSQRGCTYEEIETAIRNMWILTPKQSS